MNNCGWVQINKAFHKISIHSQSHDDHYSSRLYASRARHYRSDCRTFQHRTFHCVRISSLNLKGFSLNLFFSQRFKIEGLKFRISLTFLWVKNLNCNRSLKRFQKCPLPYLSYEAYLSLWSPESES